MARSLGWPELLPVSVASQTFPIIWSIVGAALFVAIIEFFTRRVVGAHNI